MNRQKKGIISWKKSENPTHGGNHEPDEKYHPLSPGRAGTAAVDGLPGSGAKRSTGTYLDDKAITAKVEAELVANKDTSALQVEVETYNGVVQLSGFVDSEKSKDAAEKVAQGVKGVVDVKNNLIVRGEMKQ